MSVAWSTYLRDLGRHQPSLSRKCISATRTLWAALADELPALPDPETGHSEHGGLQLFWDWGVMHVNADVLPDGTLEWFARNRETGETWGAEGCSVHDAPRALITELGLVIQHGGGDA